MPFIYHPAIRRSATSMNVRIWLVTGTAGARRAPAHDDANPRASVAARPLPGESVPFQGAGAETVSIEP